MATNARADGRDSQGRPNRAARPRPRRPTLRDVARLAGVDPSVVSRELSGQESRVRPETRARVLAAVAQLGYQPNQVARGLSLGRMLTLGVLIPSLTSPAYAAMIAGAERAACAADYVLLFAGTGDDDETMCRQLGRLAHRVDGIVMASARRDGRALQRLQQLGVPFILLNRRGGEADPCVIGDDEEGTRLAVQHLAALGHRRIACICAPSVIDTAVRRRAAFLEAMAALGLAVEPAWLVVASPGDSQGGEAAVRALLGLPEAQRPTALFCAAGLTTSLQTLAALQRLGQRIPADVSVVGFDDSPLLDYLSPPLTTVRMPHAAMGARAVELLLAHLQGQQIPRETCLEERPELVLRNSTGPASSDVCSPAPS